MASYVERLLQQRCTVSGFSVCLNNAVILIISNVCLSNVVYVNPYDRLLAHYQLFYQAQAGSVPRSTPSDTMDAKDIVQQLAGLDQFFGAQGALLNPAMLQNSQASMVTSMVQQISALRSLDLAGAALISDAIAKSQLLEPQKRVLAEAVTQRATTSAAVSPGRRATQTLTTPSRFLTTTDWVSLDDPNVMIGRKVQLVAERCIAFGLTNPSELTTKHLVGIVASAHCPDASASSLHNIVLEMKSAFTGRTTPLPFVSKLPDDPSGFSDQVKSAAYAADDPPVPRAPAGLAAILARIPMRSTNKALAASSSAGAHRSQPEPAQGPEAMARMFMQFLQTANSQQPVQFTFPGRQPPSALPGGPPS